MARESTFITVIRNDTKITREQRMEFESIAKHFEADLGENLTMSGLQLYMKYKEIPFESWKAFLTYPSIKRLIKEMVTEGLTKQAEADLTKGVGVRDALALRKAMKEENVVESNLRYIVTRLPEKKDDLDE